MAANFWKSSHCTKWIVGTDKLQAAEKRERLYLPEGIGTQVVYGLMMEVFGALKRNLNLKQQACATQRLLSGPAYSRSSQAPWCTSGAFISTILLQLLIRT
eukprot:m.42246 g.42246  ORF g.42246 m.42246 type:complete len:101 (-) comp5712_c1_seq1:733-1035(-)